MIDPERKLPFSGHVQVKVKEELVGGVRGHCSLSLQPGEAELWVLQSSHQAWLRARSNSVPQRWWHVRVKGSVLRRNTQ